MSYLTPQEFERILRRVFYEDDIGRNLDYVGGHRFRTRVYDSGDLTVGPGASVSTLSVSGVGFQEGPLSHSSKGIPPGNAFHEFDVDAQGYQPSHHHGYADVNFAQYWGLAGAGWKLNRIYVFTWNTAT